MGIEDPLLARPGTGRAEVKNLQEDKDLLLQKIDAVYKAAGAPIALGAKLEDQALALREERDRPLSFFKMGKRKRKTR